MHRELIKWLQSLDLSFPVHNPRRDLMNGFVVAEILSRYDKAVSMHSFDTGSALSKRLDNWQQVQKILDRLHCNNVSKELVSNTAQGRDGAAQEILAALFTFLTKKNITIAPVAAAQTAAAAATTGPAFMRPTAAKLLRDNNDSTKERFSKLTGQMDEKVLRQQNESVLESHQVTLQTQKYQDPDRFKPKPRPKSAAKEQRPSSTSRVRQKIQAARQMDVRTIDDNILTQFAKRQEHEREESFKAQFDADEDLSRALSRVVARPLQQAGLLEAIDEYAAASGGLSSGSPTRSEGDLSEHHASGISVTAAAAQGDYFTKFIAHRSVVPPEAKRIVWAALMETANNIAKHVHQRREELHHLVLGVETLLLKRDPGGAEEDPEDVESALALMSAVGSCWLRLDLDAPTYTAGAVLAPVCADAIAHGAPGLVARIATLASSFCNSRDVEAVKRLMAAMLAPVADASKHSRFVAQVLDAVDPAQCLGLDDVLEYYASCLLSAAAAVDRAAGVLLLRRLVGAAPKKGVAFLQQARALVDDLDWEVRMQVLQLATAMNGFPDFYPDAQEFVLEAFDAFDQCNTLVRRAALCCVAPSLDYELFPALCDAFVAKLFALGMRGVDAVLAGGGGQGAIDALPGRLLAAYFAGGLVDLWHPIAVACALVNVRGTRTSYEYLAVLDPLLEHADLTSDRSVWTAVADQSRNDIIDAVLNPANSRGVTEAQMAQCSTHAGNVAMRLYHELSGEDDADLHEDVHDDAGELHRRILERALDWLQNVL